MDFIDKNGTWYSIDSHMQDVPPSYGRLINHCTKHTNMQPEVIKVNQKWVVVFYAKRDIQPGEQLLYNYGHKYDKSGNFKNCPC